jgi:iron complex transport system ATP-binding protein
MSFSTRAVSASYGRDEVLTDISIDAPPGKLFAIIGPNGSGKSTLLRVLLGGLHPSRGSVSLDNREVHEWPRAEFARRVGVVTQIEETPFSTSVRELVAMGRYPHLGALRPESDADREAISAAMLRCDVAQFADRPLQSLSGGERQRARIARALAQTPGILVLDEPTNALDIGHEMHVFGLLRSLTREQKHTVVMATHHLNLAARYADVLQLLDRGRVNPIGNANQDMTQDKLQKVNHGPVTVNPHAGVGFDEGAPQVAPLSRSTLDQV